MTTNEKSPLPHQLQELLDSAEPLLKYDIDPPMKMLAHEDGSIDIDCPCIPIGGTTSAGVLRLHLTPLAVKSLTGALEALKTSPGAQNATSATRSSH